MCYNEPATGKIKHNEEIVLLNAQVIREVKKDGYKYLSVLETDQIKHYKMKNKDGVYQTGQESPPVKAK